MSLLQNNRVAEEPVEIESESDDEQDAIYPTDDRSDSIAAAAPENKVGYVYCMTNTAMPGLVKIGITIDLIARRDKLFSTGVPLPFDIAFARKLENTLTPLQAEKLLFRIFAQQRVYPRREFFRLGLDPVRAAFSLFGSEVDLSVLPGRRALADAIPVPIASKLCQIYHLSVLFLFLFLLIPYNFCIDSPRATSRIPKLACIGTCQIRHISQPDNDSLIGNYDANTGKITLTNGEVELGRYETLTSFANAVGMEGSTGSCFQVNVGNGVWVPYGQAYNGRNIII